MDALKQWRLIRALEVIIDDVKHGICSRMDEEAQVQFIKETLDYLETYIKIKENGTITELSRRNIRNSCIGFILLKLRHK